MPQSHHITRPQTRDLPQEDGMSFLALIIFLLVVGGTAFAVYHHESHRPDMNAAISDANAGAETKAAP